ncbi:Bardet-Biedl syndrome 2 protein homolog isoform X1 [Plodia interpunctella]|uniref:Bardet-Biedl syndrome 2 protein homolog isoform X1 n=1 Tax=Plodia interpunctella TaxID=58824 RepID=UPI002368395F|nr:Bardet-Biedl syndrome 2 protein homolog isoform X1 [Plodia interpunctella]
MQISKVQPVFKLELNHKVTPNIVTVAKYDGTHPCLTASAGYDKIIIHHPHGGVVSGRAQRSQAHGEISELNLSQAVIALAAGPLRPDSGRDMLLIGSPSQILAYDVHDNSDLFFKEAQDGVNVIITGTFGKYLDNLAIVGGNSSVQGLNWQGDEVFWNVVGGKVCSMITFDFDKDGENELLIGCEDSYIRVLKNNQFMTELAETGPVICLTPVTDVKFAYGLANGTIGIYEEGIRLWRVKSKQNTISLQWSGESLACCWENGRIDWREGHSGRVLRRVQLRSAAAAMLLVDYRSEGTPDLVCVSDRGEVLGYPPYQETTGFVSSKTLPSEEDRQAITELFNRKQALMVELQHYEANAASGSTSLEVAERPATSMPTNTRLQVAVTASPEEGCLELAIATNNETIVRAALVLAEGMFETGETLARHPAPAQLRSLLHAPLRPPRDVPVDVHIKALVGYADSEQFHIFELTKQLPRFSMYTLAPKTITSTKHGSHVTFRITERVQRICMWINQNFILEEDVELESEDAKELHVNFICLRDRSRLEMGFKADGQVKINTTDIRLAGDLVQSLAVFLNLADLQSVAHFPDAEKKLRDEMDNASDVGEMRSRLAAETAERAQLITALLPAAQDAAAYDLKEMLNRYKEVVMLNEELLAGCHVRRATQEQAVASLKNLHTILQQASRLRVGKYSKAVVTASRKAVRENNVEALVRVLQVGDA